MKILFENQHLYYLPQYESIIQELKRRKKDDIYLSLSLTVPKIEKDLFNIEAVRLGIKIIKANFEPQRCRILKDMDFDIIFVGNKTSLRSIKGKNSFVVMIYHGIGLKNSYYTDLTKDMDLICVESIDREKKLKKRGFNAVCTGFPKLDIKEIDKKKIPKDKFILYAPTFFPSSLEKTISILSKLHKYKIKIKLHHFFWTNPKYISLKNDLENEINNLSNISIFPFKNYNIIKLFFSSDLLITDFSSTIFEYLIMDQPIIQMKYYTPRLKYKLFPNLLKKRIDEDRLGQINFTFNCNKPDELIDVIDEARKNPNKHSKERVKASRKFLGRLDNKCSNRILEAILNSGISIGA